MTQQAATGFAGYATPGGWSVRATVGAILGGTLEGEEMPGAHDLQRGLLAGLGGARQWLLGEHWFIAGSATLAVAVASTRSTGQTAEPRFLAGDARIGAIAGRIIGEMWRPYVLVRGFGGPVSWSIAGADVTGTDMHHFQLGAGLSVVTAIGLTIVVDVSMLGEQAASLGISWRL